MPQPAAAPRPPRKRALLACWPCLWTLCIVTSGTALAQQAGNLEPLSGPWPAESETINVSPLPRPPAEIQRRIETGRVEFVFYDPARFRRRYAGETRFTLNYKSQSEFRWRLIRRGANRRVLLVRPHFESITFDISHQMLLPATLADQRMFEHSLVRHEFDHVRISTDPRFEVLFRKWLNEELRVIQIDVGIGEADYQSIAGREIQARVDRLFEKLLDLIRIRYRELDRATRHGEEPLPEDFFTASPAESLPAPLVVEP